MTCPRAHEASSGGRASSEQRPSQRSEQPAARVLLQRTLRRRCCSRRRSRAAHSLSHSLHTHTGSCVHLPCLRVCACLAHWITRSCKRSFLCCHKRGVCASETTGVLRAHTHTQSEQERERESGGSCRDWSYVLLMLRGQQMFKDGSLWPWRCPASVCVCVCCQLDAPVCMCVCVVCVCVC